MPASQVPAFITREALQKIRDGLKALAQKRNPNATVPKRVSRPRAVKALRAEISAALKKRYEVEDLLAVFRQQGMEIDPKSFREYWRDARKKMTGESGAG